MVGLSQGLQLAKHPFLYVRVSENQTDEVVSISSSCKVCVRLKPIKKFTFLLITLEFKKISISNGTVQWNHKHKND